MRIVGGACKKRPLRVPGKGVRPTRGLIREAIFNVLSERVVDARILDIFAGSGALGIEAISRGARHCTFIEKKSRVLRKNIAALAIKEQTRVLSEDFRPALRRSKGKSFDIIFADPPYNRNYIQPAIEMISRYALLATAGIIVVEHSSLEEYAIPEGLVKIKQKQYGDTTISFLRHRNH
jgi:16S rRNA (guanine966-N2)-methyltransferase